MLVTVVNEHVPGGYFEWTNNVVLDKQKDFDQEEEKELREQKARKRCEETLAREAAKVRKYQPICDRIDAQFRGAVIERHGHCGDGMCSIIKLLSGDGERDLMQEDTSFTAPSRTTHVAQRLVFAAVMADAAMVDDALASALHRLPRGRGARG